jgi:hypothetical protein
MAASLAERNSCVNTNQQQFSDPAVIQQKNP